MESAPPALRMADCDGLQSTRVEDDPISELPHKASSHPDHGVALLIQHSRVRPPVSVLFSTLLFCAEFVCAAVLAGTYRRSDDVIWMGLTLTFMLVPSVLTQLTLTFVHRDLGRDRPLVLFMHLLQMGPIIRCVEALLVYIQAGRKEEPYATITRKMKLKSGKAIGTPMEWEIGHSERKLAVHHNAFKRMAVIQAFLGSTPQLTLQLYTAIQEKTIIPVRLALMIISLISITYGALVCTVLSIQIHYDDYKLNMKPSAYLCMVLWRGLEIATRVTSLVLFSTALKIWFIPVTLANLLIFFFHPWVEFWAGKASMPENIEKNLSKVGTCVVLCMVTLQYACINVFCFSAVQLNLAEHELIEKHPRWNRLAFYYTLRFFENMALIVAWYFFKTDFYEYVCAPMLAVQLVICYSLAVLFMLLFYQFCHPARKLFKHNVEDCLRCVCCHRHPREAAGDRVNHTQVLNTPQLQQRAPETDILDDVGT